VKGTDTSLPPTGTGTRPCSSGAVAPASARQHPRNHAPRRIDNHTHTSNTPPWPCPPHCRTWYTSAAATIRGTMVAQNLPPVSKGRSNTNMLRHQSQLRAQHIQGASGQRPTRPPRPPWRDDFTQHPGAASHCLACCGRCSLQNTGWPCTPAGVLHPRSSAIGVDGERSCKNYPPSPTVPPSFQRTYTLCRYTNMPRKK
jgi:hypothetical protein